MLLAVLRLCIPLPSILYDMENVLLNVGLGLLKFFLAFLTGELGEGMGSALRWSGMNLKLLLAECLLLRLEWWASWWLSHLMPLLKKILPFHNCFKWCNLNSADLSIPLIALRGAVAVMFSWFVRYLSNFIHVKCMSSCLFLTQGNHSCSCFPTLFKLLWVTLLSFCLCHLRPPFWGSKILFANWVNLSCF